jgi:hypothetical protein
MRGLSPLPNQTNEIANSIVLAIAPPTMMQAYILSPSRLQYHKKPLTVPDKLKNRNHQENFWKSTIKFSLLCDHLLLNVLSMKAVSDIVVNC